MKNSTLAHRSKAYGIVPVLVDLSGPFGELSTLDACSDARCVLLIHRTDNR